MMPSKRRSSLPASESRLRDACAEIETLHIGGHGAAMAIVPMLCELLATEQSAMCGIEQDGPTPTLSWLASHGFGVPDARLASFFASWVKLGRPLFDPAALAPSERNRVCTLHELAERYGTDVASMQEGLESIAPLPAPKRHMMRVLICDGASLLAWVGGFQSSPVRAAQTKAFRLLIPSIQRRLIAERRLAASPQTEAALAVALEMIGAPACVLSKGGAIVHANAAGRALLQTDRETFTDAVNAGLSGRPSSIPLVITPLAGATDGCLVVVRGVDREIRLVDRARAAAARWGLTAREAVVLDLLANGHANRTIAHTLRISERTVEFHVTRIFDKAGVESRSAVVSALISEG